MRLGEVVLEERFTLQPRYLQPCMRTEDAPENCLECRNRGAPRSLGLKVSVNTHARTHAHDRHFNVTPYFLADESSFSSSITVIFDLLFDLQ